MAETVFLQAAHSEHGEVVMNGLGGIGYGSEINVHFRREGDSIRGRAAGLVFIPLDLAEKWEGKNLPEENAVWRVRIRYDKRQRGNNRYCEPVAFRSIYLAEAGNRTDPQTLLHRRFDVVFGYSGSRVCAFVDGIRAVASHNWPGPLPEAGDELEVVVIAVARDQTFVYAMPAV